VCKGIILAVMRAECVIRISYMILRSCLCDILNVHSPTDDKSDHKKGSFCQEPD
jgi:hypothetical protein